MLLRTPKLLKINTKSALVLWILFSLAVFGWSQSTFLVETFYAKAIYPLWNHALKRLFGWIPFSIGDVIYLTLFLILGYKFFVWIVSIFKNGFKAGFNIEITRIVFIRLLQVYVYFMLSWGLLYGRKSIEEQMGWGKVQPASIADLHAIRCELIDSVRILRQQLGKDTILKRPEWNELQQEVSNAYQSIQLQNFESSYTSLSLKPTLLNWLGKYVGFTGYFNPFTHEAQVRTHLPAMALPFVSTHEIAHQLGYASESEASWVGFLAARSSKNILFRYSAYMDLLFVVEQALYDQDVDFKSMYVGRYKSEIDWMVRSDRKQYILFFMNEETNFSSWVQDISKATYQTYLIANGESAGLASYQLWLHWAVYEWKQNKAKKL